MCLTPAWPHSAGEGCTCPESARLAVQVGCAAGQKAVAGRAGKAEQVSWPGAGQAEAAQVDLAERISLQVSLRRIDRGWAGQDSSEEVQAEMAGRGAHISAQRVHASCDQFGSSSQCAAGSPWPIVELLGVPRSRSHAPSTRRFSATVSGGVKEPLRPN